MKPIYSISPEIYSSYRPTYGDDIYNYISSLLEEKQIGWDCACGSGQATTEVAKFVDYVIGSDSDSIQLENATKAKNIKYLHQTDTIDILKDSSVDLITVATGIHWLDTNKFYAEAKRVLKKGGVLATWGYTGVDLNPEINDVIKGIIKNHLLPYYPKEIQIAFNQYREIDLPMNKINAPNFEIKYNWDFETLMNYIKSFTAMQRYLKVHEKSALALFEDEILDAWGGDRSTKKELIWELHTKFTRK
tara:strand:- start:504 stop:1244 length:741 start_codon:yes stop_codon:yes gene_type:complete